MSILQSLGLSVWTYIGLLTCVLIVLYLNQVKTRAAKGLRVPGPKGLPLGRDELVRLARSYMLTRERR